MEKLLRRDKAKPLHHNDTSIIIESIRETRIFSLVGEFFIKVLSEIGDDYLEKERYFRYLYEIIWEKKIRFFVPADLKLPIEINGLDSRIMFTDASIVACAVEERAILVTLDKEIINNRKLEIEYCLKVRPPAELI